MRWSSELEQCRSEINNLGRFFIEKTQTDTETEAREKISIFVEDSTLIYIYNNLKKNKAPRRKYTR